MKVPEKIYLNPDAVSYNQNGKFLFIHNSDIDESKCTIEYVCKNTFIEKACEFIEYNITGYIDVTHKGGDVILQHEFIKDFRKYMQEE